MSKKEKQDIPMWARLGHGRPVSRRELLASGMISFSAYLVLPSWISLAASTANAQVTGVCAQGAAGGLIPYLTLNLAGGAGLQANFVPHDEGGQRLANYDRMGLGNNGARLPLEMEFGNVPFAGKKPGTEILISQFLAGLRSRATVDAIARTAFVAVNTTARDDSSENKLSPTGLLAQAGLQGSLLPFLGTERTATGVRQLPAIIKPPSPLIVSSLNSLVGSIVPAGDLPNFLSVQQRSSLLNLVSKLTSSQVRKLSSDSQGTETKNLLECANIKNEQVKSLVDSGAVVIDPRRDTNGAALSTLWGINAGTNASDDKLVFASMTYNVLRGNAGAGALEMGGYDYHDNTRTNGNLKDFNAGVVVGQALETARLLGKKLFIHVTTDGGVDAGDKDGNNVTFEAKWTSDRGQANVSYILYYDPAGRAATSGFQVNHFTAGQEADQTTILGTSEGAAVAVFANYLKLNNRMDLFTGGAASVLNGQLLTKAIKFA